jgi:hypothetical protein
MRSASVAAKKPSACVYVYWYADSALKGPAAHHHPPTPYRWTTRFACLLVYCFCVLSSVVSRLACLCLVCG